MSYKRCACLGRGMFVGIQKNFPSIAQLIYEIPCNGVTIPEILYDLERLKGAED